MGLSKFLLAGALLFLWPAPAFPQQHVTAGRAAVDPQAMAALRRSIAYFGNLRSFALHAEMTVEAELGGRVVSEAHALRYEYRAPDGLLVDWRWNGESRQLYFNGGAATFYMPATGTYYDLPDEGSAADVLMAAAEDFGIVFPLPDPFLWSVLQAPPDIVERAWHAGRERIGGALTDHYVIREPEIDWQIWIQRGDRPLPRKIVIAARDDPNHPRLTARLRWTLEPRFTIGHFIFRPPRGTRPLDPTARSRPDVVRQPIQFR